MPPWLAPAYNELPAKITAAGPMEEGTARLRVINEPDVLVVNQAQTGRHGDAGPGHCVGPERRRRWRR